MWRDVIVIMGVISLVWYISTPVVIRASKEPWPMSAQINIRQIGNAMIDFQTEYGRFPDASTIAAVQPKNRTAIPLGTKTSNDFFRQLIVSKLANSEQFFYVPTNDSKHPDEKIEGAKALAKGECGFSYIFDPVFTDGDRPLLVAPLVPGTTRFDPKALKGRAVIFKADGSTRWFPIDGSGNVMLDGKPLFDPANPVWNGRPPVITWPE